MASNVPFFHFLKLISAHYKLTGFLPSKRQLSTGQCDKPTLIQDARSSTKQKKQRRRHRSEFRGSHCHEENSRCKQNQREHEPETDLFQCIKCNEVFKDKDAYNQHKKPIVCCGKTFRYPSMLLNHQKSQAHLLKFHCLKCGNSFNKEEDLHTHAETCTETAARTSFCSMKDEAEDSLKIFNGFWCNKCHETLASREEYLDHQKPIYCCGVKFISSTHLLLHRASISHRKKFHCPKCGSSFIEKKDCDLHCKSCKVEGRRLVFCNMKIDPLQTDLLCRLCFEVLGSQEEFDEHQKPIVCCGKAYDNSETLSSHRRTLRHRQLFHCIKCGSAFLEEMDYLTHDKNCSGTGKRYIFCHMKSYARSSIPTVQKKCKECEEVFMTEEEYNNHAQSCSETKSFKCCGLSFKYESHFKRHQKSRFHNRKMTCQICKQIFTSAEAFTAHRKEEHNEVDGKWFCNICNAGFSTNGILTRHKTAVHFKAIEFQCNNCPFITNRKELLERHFKRKHLHTPADVTCETCGKAFHNNSALVSHMKIHDRNMHQCSICARTFHDLQDLKVHKITHLPGKNFHCQVCGKSFKTYFRRETHFVRHQKAPCKRDRKPKPVQKPSWMSKVSKYCNKFQGRSFQSKQNHTIKNNEVISDTSPNVKHSDLKTEIDDNLDVHESSSDIDVECYDRDTSAMTLRNAFFEGKKESIGSEDLNTPHIIDVANVDLNEDKVEFTAVQLSSETYIDGVKNVLVSSDNCEFPSETMSTLKGDESRTCFLPTVLCTSVIEVVNNKVGEKVEMNDAKDCLFENQPFVCQVSDPQISQVEHCNSQGLTENLNRSVAKKRNSTLIQNRKLKKNTTRPKSLKQVCKNRDVHSRRKSCPRPRLGKSKNLLSTSQADTANMYPNALEEKGQNFCAQHVDDRNVFLLPELLDEDFENHALEADFDKDENMMEKVLSLDEFLFDNPNKPHCFLSADINDEETSVTCLTSLVPVPPLQDWVP